MKTILYKGRRLSEVHISDITIENNTAWFDVSFFSIRYAATFDTLQYIAKAVCKLHLDAYEYKEDFYMAPREFGTSHRVTLKVREKECMEYWIENNK